MENLTIRKFKSWDEVPKNDLEFWLTKTPAERLEAARRLTIWAKELYLANPKNPRPRDGRHVSKFHSPAERARD